MQTRIPVFCSSGNIRFAGMDHYGVRVLDTRGRQVAAETDVCRRFILPQMPGGVYVVVVSGTGFQPESFKMLLP
ncbi:MAG: hypothetical protein JW863_20790 [Chitinispirillaceae bacterium]|nr:hypothetical protein [Chitinispirillaceae bacterium]